MAQIVSLSNRGLVQRIYDRVLQKPVAHFLLFWFALNLLQVALMELTSDEGYYWFYAQRLQWGYYDHPPMIALLIRLGSSVLPGELGVRFFNVLLSTAGLWLFFQLLPGEYKKSSRTYLVLLSAPLLHYLTFLLFPDGPLLFFSLLFLVFYKRFLAHQNFSISVLLGVSLTLMAYSKYHGVLVLLFTVLANPKLLKSFYFYISLLVAAVLFLPHLWWQYSHDFPTLKYHLSGRTGGVSFRHVGEYLSQQLVAIGPGLLFIPFVRKTRDVFERTLKAIIIGSFLFFLVSSFKTFVHFHWTSIALYPLLYFAVAYYHQPGKRDLFRWVILPFIVLFFLARLLLMVPFIPDMHVGEDYYHGRKEWAKSVATVAGGRYVFMPNNLREASLYSYYSGKEGVTLYTRPEKKSQYELWGYEDSLQGKEVVLVTKQPFEGSRLLPNNLQEKLSYSVFPHFSSYYSGVSISAAIKQVADSLEAEVQIFNHRSTPLNLGQGLKGERTTLILSFEKGKETVKTGILYFFSPADQIPPNGSTKRNVKTSLKDLPANDYAIFFGIRNGLLPDAILSEKIFFERKK